MMVMWVVMFFGWLAARIMFTKPIVFLIPEPLNTYLFFFTGLVLFGWLVIKGVRESQFLHRTAEEATSPQNLLEISPTQFEKMVVELYNLHGYKAERTGAIGDHGVDVIVHSPKGEKWIVQCKRWRGSVGEPVVRDFFGTLHHEKADRGVLVTTGTFTRQAQDWAKGKPLMLIDGEEFLKTWKKEIGEGG